MPIFDFDKRLGIMVPKSKRQETDIHLMNQFPAKSCFIKFLQNRVNLNSVGNIRSAKVMYYDYRTRMVSDTPDGKDAVDFRSFTLPSGERPVGWIYVNK